MASDNAIKFSFAFSLAVLLHLLVIAVILLGLSVEYTISVKKPIPAMQATLLDTTQINQLSQTEETRRAIAQQRLEQVAKEKLLANAAQTMLLKAIRKKALEQQHALVSKRTTIRNSG
jgi:hypothetical protein